MATISERLDDRGLRIGWQVRVRKRGFPVLTKTFRNKAEAQAWAKVTEAEMERGQWRDRTESEATNLVAALDRYAEEIAPRSKDGGFRVKGYIRQWKQRKIARLSLARVRSKDVADAIAEMEAEGKSANTIRLHLAVISHLYSVAATEWGMEALANPVQAAKARKPRLPQGRDRRLVGDEEQRLLEACTHVNPELADIVILAIETAMRQGEILSMEWIRINWIDHTCYLPGELVKNETARIVPLSVRAEEALQRQQRRGTSKNDRVWKYTSDGLRASYNKAVKRAGIEGLTFHDLRHEATSRFCEKGIPMMTVQAITGHKTTQMLKRYTHISGKTLVDAVRG